MLNNPDYNPTAAQLAQALNKSAGWQVLIGIATILLAIISILLKEYFGIALGLAMIGASYNLLKANMHTTPTQTKGDLYDTSEAFRAISLYFKISAIVISCYFIIQLTLLIIIFFRPDLPAY